MRTPMTERKCHNFEQNVNDDDDDGEKRPKRKCHNFEKNVNDDDDDDGAKRPKRKCHNFEQNVNVDGDDNFEMCEETPISSKTISEPVVSKRAKLLQKYTELTPNELASPCQSPDVHVNPMKLTAETDSVLSRASTCTLESFASDTATKHKKSKTKLLTAETDSVLSRASTCTLESFASDTATKHKKSKTKKLTDYDWTPASSEKNSECQSPLGSEMMWSPDEYFQSSGKKSSGSGRSKYVNSLINFRRYIPSASERKATQIFTSLEKPFSKKILVKVLMKNGIELNPTEFNRCYQKIKFAVNAYL